MNREYSGSSSQARYIGHIRPAVLQAPPKPRLRLGLHRISAPNLFQGGGLHNNPFYVPAPAQPSSALNLVSPIVSRASPASSLGNVLAHPNEPSSSSASASVAHPVPQQVYAKGQNIEYFSASVNDWIQAIIEDVCPTTGAVQLNCKRGVHLDLREQQKKLRIPSRPDSEQLQRVIQLLSSPESLNEEAEAWWRKAVGADGNSEDGMGLRELQVILTAIEKIFGLPRTHHTQWCARKMQIYGKTHRSNSSTLSSSRSSASPARASIPSLLTKDEWHSLYFDLLWQTREENGNVMCVTKAIAMKTGDPYEFYEMLSSLGKGTFGEVYKAQNRATHEMVAIKKLSKVISPMAPEFLEREITSLKSLDHPHIVKLYEYFDYSNDIFLVMDLCTGGTLLQTMQANRNLAEIWIAKVMRQVLLAVNYVHARGIIHRDLKDENVMLVPAENGTVSGTMFADFTAPDSTPHAIIIDMGIAAVFQPGSDVRPCGTPVTMAPEAWEGVVSPKGDIFSLGCILFELLCGRYAFAPPSVHEALQYWKSRPQFPKHLIKRYSNAAVVLCTEMSHIDAERRPTAQGCLKLVHDWIDQESTYSRSSKQEDKPLLTYRGIAALEHFSELDDGQKALRLLIASKIPGYRMLEVSRQFLALDRDGLGVLCISEVSLVLQNCGMSEGDANRTSKSMNVSRNGTIGWTEFLAANLSNAPLELERGLYAVYESYNARGALHLDRSDVERLLDGELANLGLVQPEAERLSLLDALDPEDDDVVTLIRFKDHFRQKIRDKLSDSPEVSDALISAGLAKLDELGFTNRVRNEYLLRKHGSVATVCDVLFAIP
eukprot:GEMP01015468.1.p1 GENE.GEMP01015468.1~~GEMP01015468.1.p1  ORF type:complete len:829 (+),score=161.69 GEMP01015468.1:126-2612(+)